MEIIGCPTCGAPAELDVWAVHGSSRGRVEHVRILCVRRHWALMPRDLLVPSQRRPTGDS